MRFFIILFFILLVFHGCATKIVTTPPPVSGTESVDISKPVYLWAFKPNINVRSADNTTSSKIAELADGDSVEILTNQDGWYEVRLKDNQSGWIRSDLLGPRNLSVFRQAVTFADSLKDHHQINLFFDKNLYHKRIYLQFPVGAYTDRNTLEQRTRNLIKDYQQTVYNGPVTVRVLQPHSEAEYFTLSIDGAINSEPVLPIIPFGWIKKVIQSDPASIQLQYEIPGSISDSRLLKSARNMVETIPLSYTSVEFTFTSKTDLGEMTCRLWFHEGQTGEEYRFNFCP